MSSNSPPRMAKINGHRYLLAADVLDAEGVGEDTWQFRSVAKALDDVEAMMTQNSVPTYPDTRLYDLATMALYGMLELYRGNRKEADKFLEELHTANRRLRADLQKAGVL